MLKFSMKEVEMMIGERIKILRNEKGIGQDEFAKIFNVSRQAYAAWESNKNEPSLDIIYKLAEYHGVTIDFLFGRTNIREDVYKDPTLQTYINECIKIYKRFLNKERS